MAFVYWKEKSQLFPQRLAVEVGGGAKTARAQGTLRASMQYTEVGESDGIHATKPTGH